MSHLVLVQVAVSGMAGLLQAVVDTGLAFQKERRFQTDDGKSHDVDLVVTDEEGARVGVKVDEKTGRARFIAHDCKGTKGQTLANRIAQRYAYSKAVGELERKGYEITTEKNEADGSIRIVAQRWK